MTVYIKENSVAPRIAQTKHTNTTTKPCVCVCASRVRLFKHLTKRQIDKITRARRAVFAKWLRCVRVLYVCGARNSRARSKWRARQPKKPAYRRGPILCT